MSKPLHPTREVLRDARTASIKMILDTASREGEHSPLLDLAAVVKSLETLKGRLDARVIFDDGESIDITQVLLARVS